MQPFSKTEGLGFRKLIEGLTPKKSIMCRKTVMERINERFQKMRKNLMSTLQQQRFVATTTDCWSAHHKSYIGLTIYWIDQATMDRKSAALSCRRLKGSHTYEVLAEALEGIHSEYGIIDKIVKTTTDNGSNFCKAFAMFGEDFNIENETALTTSANNSNTDINTDVSAATSVGEVNTGEIEFNAVDELLRCTDGDFRLPAHQRCACHTLNLVATTDACAAESDAVFKKTCRSTFAKCQAMWNKQSRSVQASELIADTFGLHLVVPNQTRWNSTYFAVERLNRVVGDKGLDALNSLCDKLGLVQFRRTEVAFLSEYVTVMKPLATALDILQCETKAFMAYLVPTLVVLMQKLQFLQQTASIQCCK